MSRYRMMMALACAAATWCAAPPTVTHAAQARAGGAAWGQAIEVPGLGALNADRLAEVVSVSCASAGNCAAGGYYTDGSSNGQAFVASQRNGRWGTAIQLPGTATQLRRHRAGVWRASPRGSTALRVGLAWCVRCERKRDGGARLHRGGRSCGKPGQPPARLSARAAMLTRNRPASRREREHYDSQRRQTAELIQRAHPACARSTGGGSGLASGNALPGSL